MFLFTKKSVGLEIADHTIEVVELEKRGMKVKILSLGRVLLEPGIVKRGRIKDEERLTRAVKEVFLKAKPHPIVTKKLIFGLPESQVYIHIFELEPHNKKERDSLVLNRAQTSIPLEKDDLLFSYKVLHEGKDKVEILLVATSKEVAREWWQFFQKLKLEVETFDIESLATFRDLFAKSPREPVCMVDIGAVTTTIAIFDKKGLRYSHSINVAGDAFTREIAEALEIKLEEAEKQKIKIGLADKDSRIFSVLIKALEPISKEVKTLLSYFQEKTKQEVTEIILVGGSSKLKGIVDYFNTNLGLPTRVGKSSLLETKVPLEYLEAIGLALRGVDKKWSQKDPALSVESSLFAKALEGEPKKKAAPTIERPVIEEEGVSLPSVTVRDQARKLRAKKILLVVILIIGVAIVSLAFWYRNHERAEREKELESQVAQYTKTQSFDLKIPVAVNPVEYTLDRARGRIIENTIQVAGHYNEAVAHSRIAVEKELKEGERLWLTPISPEQTVFPMTIKWFVYSEEDTNKLFLKEVDELNKDKVDYVLNNIEKKNIEPTENPNIFYLMGEITISLNQLIEVEKGESLEKEEIIEITESVLIKETETGWLRVREKPGTIYPEIAKVYSGETYPLLEESEGWYKIQLENGRQGWIFAQYASKQ